MAVQREQRFENLFNSLGPLVYLAPEQLQGHPAMQHVLHFRGTGDDDDDDDVGDDESDEEDLDVAALQAADRYSFGVLLAELFNRSPPSMLQTRPWPFLKLV
jgi:serine/threonine protein kinase